MLLSVERSERMVRPLYLRLLERGSSATPSRPGETSPVSTLPFSGRPFPQCRCFTRTTGQISNGARVRDWKRPTSSPVPSSPIVRPRSGVNTPPARAGPWPVPCRLGIQVRGGGNPSDVKSCVSQVSKRTSSTSPSKGTERWIRQNYLRTRTSSRSSPRPPETRCPA